MTDLSLTDLQAIVQDRFAFNNLTDYVTLCSAFLAFIERTHPTRIISPSQRNYVFYQYDEPYGYRITRPLNTDLFIEMAHDFRSTFERFAVFLNDLKRYNETTIDQPGVTQYVSSREINKVVYTIQQAIGSILLNKLIGRDIPVVAIFLHDVQRALRGNSIFGVNSTFKSNHFLGYTVAFNKLDGVYYVDPRPEMLANKRLREQIHDFQQFLVKDLWVLSNG